MKALGEISVLRSRHTAVVTWSSEWLFARDFGYMQRHPPTKSLSWRDRQLGSLGGVAASQEPGRGPVNLMYVSPDLRVTGKVSVGKIEGAAGWKTDTGIR